MDGKAKLHECDFPGCAKSFPKLWRLKEHQCSAHTGERPHVCTHPGCDKSFIRRYHLKRHMISHLHGDDKPTFTCCHPGCGRSYTLKQNLRKHEKGHALPLPYKCSSEGCEAAFKKRSQLSLHRSSQHGENTELLKCSYPDCSKVFSSPKDLKRHRKTHTGYRCTVAGCAAVCGSWTEMRRHSSTHSKVCPECGKTFTRNRQLRLHSAVHAPSRCVLTCKWKDCGRTYTTLYNLQQHISSFHCHEKLHVCGHDGCEAAFSTKQACWRHWSSEHSNQIKPKRKRRKKRSLASHLSGYVPVNSKPASSTVAPSSSVLSAATVDNTTAAGISCGVPAAAADEGSAGGEEDKRETHQDYNNTSNFVLVKSAAVRCSGLPDTAVPIKTLKFLVPVVSRFIVS